MLTRSIINFCHLTLSVAPFSLILIDSLLSQRSIAAIDNFERLVQPALGVLMIASVGSNFFKEDEDGQGMM
jgi:hypothetical protein